MKTPGCLKLEWKRHNTYLKIKTMNFPIAFTNETVTYFMMPRDRTELFHTTKDAIFEYNSIEQDFGEYEAKAAGVNVIALHIWYTNRTWIGCYYLDPMDGFSQTIKALTLCNNKIADITELVRCLPPTKLELLSLKNNLIKDLTYLVFQLPRCPNLRHLNLSENPLLEESRKLILSVDLFIETNARVIIIL